MFKEGNGCLSFHNIKKSFLQMLREYNVNLSVKANTKLVTENVTTRSLLIVFVTQHINDK